MDNSKYPQKWIAKPLVSTQRVRAPEWFVHGMLPENSLAVLYGDPGSFKTFEFIGVAMCLATGLPFCGRQTKQCDVLYIAADPDPDTPKERAQAWTKYYASVLKEHGIANFSNAGMFDKAVNLHNQSEVEAARDAIKAQDLKPGVIFFDTLFHSSIGADLMKPEQMLPIIERARWLTAQVGARTGFIAHHTPKHGKTLFGTQALLATVDVVWRSDKINENTAKVTCERIKRAKVFAPINLTFHSMELQMIPNSFGDEWVEQLVLDLNVQPTTMAKTKEDQDLENMEFQLEALLGNKATFTDWLEQMWKYSNIKNNDRDKKGWSKRSFARKLDTLRNTGRITGGGQQGDLYSVAHTPEAEQARHKQIQPEPSKTGASNTGASQVVTGPQLSTVAPVGTAFGLGNQCQTSATATDGTGSSRSGNGENGPVVPDGAEAAAKRAKELLEQLKRKPNAA